MTAIGGHVETTVLCHCGDYIPDDALMCDGCRFAADPFTVDRIAALLERDPNVLHRARILPKEAREIAERLLAGLETAP